jgi:hypothetical protein
MRLAWRVRLRVPAGTNVSALATAMPHFRHLVDGSHLAFGAVDLRSSNAAVELHVRPVPHPSRLY